MTVLASTAIALAATASLSMLTLLGFGTFGTAGPCLSIVNKDEAMRNMRRRFAIIIGRLRELPDFPDAILISKENEE